MYSIIRKVNAAATTEKTDDFKGPLFANTSTKNVEMEKKMFGIILTVLGIAGLIAAAVNFANTKGGSNYKLIFTYAILGGIFFFAGIGLMKGTRDNSA
jgi:uncharacterized membrane protein